MAPATAVPSLGKKCSCGAAPAPIRWLGEGCSRAGRHRAGSRDTFSPRGAAPGPTIHLENAHAAAAAHCTPLWGICLPLRARPWFTHPHCSPGPAPPRPQPR